MSTRRGYYWLSGEGYEGPFPTIKEAKADASERAANVSVSICTLVTVEHKTYPSQEWQTVH